MPGRVIRPRIPRERDPKVVKKLVVAAVVALVAAAVGRFYTSPPGKSADWKLLECSKRGDLAGMDAALKEGADIKFAVAPSPMEARSAEFPNPENGYTALHYAAISGKPEAVKKLVEAGAPLDARSSLGNTPLMLAVGQLDVDSAKYLIVKGADTAAKNNEGIPVLNFAIKRGTTPKSSALMALLKPSKSKR